LTGSFFLLALLCLLAGSIASGLLYFRQKAYSGKLLVSVLFVLRMLGFALLLFVLIAPLISFTQKERVKPVLAVLIDNSKSMVLSADSAQVRNNLEAAIRENLKDAGDAELQFFRFDNNLGEGQPDYTGTSTDLAVAIQRVRKIIDPKRLRALVVASDGIVNRGVNPLYEVENALIPVYTIGVGDSARQRDVAIQEIRSPRFVYRGDEVLVDVTIRASNVRGERIAVALNQGSRQVNAKTVEVNAVDFASVVQFRFNTAKPGLFAYDLTIPALPEEKNTRNNAKRFYIEVIENRKQITIVAAAPHPDVAAVREALKSVDAYEVGYQNLGSAGRLQESELLILFMQPGFSEEQYSRLMDDYTGPLWVFVDPEIDGRVVSNLFDGLSLINNRRAETVQARLNPSFGLFKLSAETRDMLRAMPAVQATEGELQTAEPFEVLLTGRAGKKLAQYGNWKQQRLALFNMGGLWNWRVSNYRKEQTQRHVDEMIQTTVQYLTADQNANRLRLYYEPRQVLGDAIAVRAEVYDAAFQITDEARVELAVTNPSGTKQEFDMLPESPGYGVTLNGLDAGNYTLRAQAQLGDETLTANGELLIEELGLEDMNLRANYALLQQMATASGGAFYTLNTMASLSGDLNEKGTATPIERIKTNSVPLIDIWWLLFVAMLFLSVEWLLRRYYGRI
jgi:hypothetical protein